MVGAAVLTMPSIFWKKEDAEKKRLEEKLKESEPETGLELDCDVIPYPLAALKLQGIYVEYETSRPNPYSQEVFHCQPKYTK